MQERFVQRIIVLTIVTLIYFYSPSFAQKRVVLSIESWRADDINIWEKIILPQFHQRFAKQLVRIRFTPTEPMSYNQNLHSRLRAGMAGDLIACRPFDLSLRLYQQKYLLPLNQLKGIENFSVRAKSAWSTDRRDIIYCVPLASVIHGFIYNAKIFDKLKLVPPQTEADLFRLLDRVRKKSSYTPLAFGTADQWSSNELVFQNIGPNYWQGERGRLQLIQGKTRFTDSVYVELLKTLARWQPYLSSGFESQSYDDSLDLFIYGQAAIYPSGSFEIGRLTREVKFKMGAFTAPVRKKGDPCFISDHLDMGIGINAASRYVTQAKMFLTWITTAEFAQLYADALPGFFPLSRHKIKIKNPLSRQFLSWRKRCQSTIRNDTQILSRGKPSLKREITLKATAVINGVLSPKMAAKQLQQSLDRWYHP